MGTSSGKQPENARKRKGDISKEGPESFKIRNHGD
jgi:hypothetical protein